MTAAARTLSAKARKGFAPSARRRQRICAYVEALINREVFVPD
jgi:hypothetical protein